MEYRRRRKRKTDGPGMFGILVLLIVFALTAKIIAGSGAIAELKKRLGKSVVSGCAESSRETPGATFYAASPSPAPVPTGVTNRIDLPSLGFYAVQLGFYTRREKCELDAEEVRALGAAGYVYDDNGSLRLLASVYADEASARSVIEQLKEQGRESLLFTLSANGVSLDVTSSPETSECIKQLFDLCLQIPETICTEAIEFDRSGQEADKLFSILSEQRARIRSALAEAPGAGGVLGCAKDCLKGYDSALSETMEYEDRTKAASSIKRAAIKCAILYIDLLKDAACS